MGSFSRKFRCALRGLAGLFLLLNLCVATIPRCELVVSFLQQALEKQSWSSLTHHHDGQACKQGRADGSSSAISGDQFCACSLAKFLAFTLNDFDPQGLIGFRIQTSTLIRFDYTLWNPAAQKAPEPPYPRRSLV